ncbi:hypothetical protein [Candidatus Sororendozoicomonas aggregata]|uniref:hypothetical protein n=1 Tax=Candidatus Sororendozoicomonas aggregata TaxID=3073239 RepID=UPI002ED29C80
MFDKCVQCPSVAALSLAFFCLAHAATADAKVYSVTGHGGAKVTSDVGMRSEAVDVVTQLNITVPEYGVKSYAEIKADVYIKLNYGELKAANNASWFGFSMSHPKHGGPFGKEKFTLRVWCNNSGSDGYIVRKHSGSEVKYGFIVGDISCKKQ